MKRRAPDTSKQYEVVGCSGTWMIWDETGFSNGEVLLYCKETGDDVVVPLNKFHKQVKTKS